MQQHTIHNSHFFFFGVPFLIPNNNHRIECYFYIMHEHEYTYWVNHHGIDQQNWCQCVHSTNLDCFGSVQFQFISSLPLLRSVVDVVVFLTVIVGFFSRRRRRRCGCCWLFDLKEIQVGITCFRTQSLCATRFWL